MRQIHIAFAKTEIRENATICPLNQAVSRTEEALQRKQFTLGAFLGIEEAIDQGFY